MSRNIEIKAIYNNNKSVIFGCHNPKNAEYYESIISLKDIKKAFNRIKEKISGKTVKKVIVTHIVSTGNSNSQWPWINIEYPDLNCISVKNIFDVNYGLHIPYNRV